jgi:hypothetical protein
MRGGGVIAQRAQLHDHARGHVQPARFQHARHQRHPRQAIVRGLFGHFPQAVVGVEVAVVVAEFAQPRAQQHEVARLVVRHLHPVGVERAACRGSGRPHPRPGRWR